MIKNTFIALSSLLLAVACGAQTPQEGTLQLAAPSSLYLPAKRLERIDSLFQVYINNQWMAGATALVAKDGKILYYKGAGYKDVARKEAMPKDAIFRIASQTKAITSVGIMMLVEEGKLSLNDAVSKFIPEFKKPRVLKDYNAADTTYTTVPAKREITLHDLLTHTSGIGYAQIGSPTAKAIYYKAGVVGGIGVDRLRLADKMKILGTLPLFHQPGEQFTYGLNTDVLGYVIEVASGLSLDQFFQKRIFQPLGMRDTYFYLPPAKRSRLVTLYTENAEKKIVPAPDTVYMTGNFYPDYPRKDGTYFSGGGGLSSTAYDYALFMQMLLNGGTYNGKRLLKKETVDQMTTNQIGSLSVGQGDKFGLGFQVIPESNSGKSPLSVGTFSWGGMFSSTYWIDPKEKIVGQLFINQYPNSHTDIQGKFKALVYEALKGGN
ncbi:serine hydrolase domain-containing protein [Paraflavisolibacter sp. H34]|uniref:serine hydrolase domain-containing protein n=1 Tax=Huijunlia imazamoxiresistens TaxID=3127457 RepID=UPI0030179E87